MKLRHRLLVLVFLVLFHAIGCAESSSVYPDQYNIVWETQSKNASDSMPVGGGDIGLNVWVEKNELLLYMQRSGVHDEYNGFPKLGRVRIWTEPNVFAGADVFRQELKLREGYVEISAKHAECGDVRFRVWAEVHQPKVQIECKSGKAITYYAQYESWRTEPRRLSIGDERERDRWGWWDTGGWPYAVVLEPDQFLQEKDRFTFYHINPEEKLTSKMAYKIMGLGEYYGKYFEPLKDLVWGGRMDTPGMKFDDRSEGKYFSTDYVGWRYKSKLPSTSQDITFFFRNSRCGSGEKWLEGLEASQEAAHQSKDEAWAANLKWWKAFWDKSYIVLNPEKDENDPVWCVGRNYNLFRFMTALNAYGENPTMFNGGLLSVDPGTISKRMDFHPDWRAWSGGNYTLQNQRWVYWPMLKWGDFEHMESQFNFFSRNLDVYKLRVEKNYGHPGILIEEVGTVYGLPMPMHYGFEDSYIEKRIRQDWMEPGLSSNWCVAHHHTAMLEFSHMILEYYRYSGRDISKWLPIVKGTIDFYDHFYRTRAKYNANFMEYDAHGKLIIFPSGACESHYWVSNPVPDIAGLMAIARGAKRLPDEWVKRFFDSREELERFENTIPDFHTEEYKGDVVMPPGKSVAYSWWKKTELYINYPMFPFNIIELGDEEMEYVHNTYRHWERWQTPDAWKFVRSWTNGNVAFARMGIIERAAELTQKTLEDGPFRFPSFWGPGYDWVPDHNWGGTGSVGLQEMLVQTLDDKIVLLPSWPDSWNADFRIHAPKNTTVEASFREGEVKKLITVPVSRKRDVICSKRGW